MFNLSLCLIRKQIGSLARELCVPERRWIFYTHFILNKKNYSSCLLFKNSYLLVSSDSRHYAKGRNIIKDKKKQVKVDENELKEYFELEKLFTDFEKPIEFFKEELKTHASLRTSSNVIESVKINFEGDTYTIQDLAECGKKNPKLYVLDFSSFPGAIPIVIKTLQDSELNLNVQQDGNKIFVPIPKVTKEHRENLAKKSKVYFHKCRESIRNVQKTYEKKLSKIEKLSVEEKFRITEQLTTLGNKQINLAEEILKAKHEELLKEDKSV